MAKEIIERIVSTGDAALDAELLDKEAERDGVESANVNYDPAKQEQREKTARALAFDPDAAEDARTARVKKGETIGTRRRLVSDEEYAAIVAATNGAPVVTVAADELLTRDKGGDEQETGGNDGTTPTEQETETLDSETPPTNATTDEDESTS